MFDETKLADAAFLCSMKQSWPTQHFRLLWRPSNSPYQAAMGRPLEGFQKVLEKTPTRHSHPATRLPMNPIRMLLMNIIIIFIIIIIIGGTAAAVLVFACVACVLVSVGLC